MTSVGEDRASLFLLITRNFIVSVRKSCLILWVLWKGYIILLWHSLCFHISNLHVLNGENVFGDSFYVKLQVRFKNNIPLQCRIINCPFLRSLHRLLPNGY